MNGLLSQPKSSYWERFGQVSCDAISAFYQMPESDIIAEICGQRLEGEIGELKERLAAPRSRSRPACGSRIVLCNHQLRYRGGAALSVRDMAQFCLDQGFAVAAYSPALGSPVADAISSLGAKVTSSVSDIVDFAPNLIHVNHYSHAQPLVEAFAGTNVRFVNMIHGILPRAEMPQPANVDRYVCVSLAVKAKTFLLTGIKWEQIPLLPNFFNERYFKPAQFEPQGKRAILFSRRATATQVLTMRDLMRTFGYQLDHVGDGQNVISDPERVLPTYDIAFAVGRSAIEALVCGCRVILWDDGVIGPSVNLQSFWPCVTFNFALASKRLPYRLLDGDDAKPWIGDQLAAVTEKVRQQVVDEARSYLSLENVGPLLLQIYDQALDAQSRSTQG